MTAHRAEMYNRKVASPASKPEQILEILDLQPGQKVADIGSGYYALRFDFFVLRLLDISITPFPQ